MSPRPARTGKEQIVTAAVDLLDAEGVECFSMRRLGSAMGLDPMTIYHHVPNKAALFDAVVDHVWTSIPLPDPAVPQPWDEAVAAMAMGLREALLEHPSLLPLVATRPAVTPHLLEVLDRTVGCLAADGLACDEAMRLLDCVIGYVVGKVQGELRRPMGGVDTSTADAMATLTPETHPYLATALRDGYDWSPEAEFARGLRALLRGWTVGG